MLRYYVTDRRQGDVLASATRAVENGVDMVQIREKDMEAGALFDLVRHVVQIADGTPTKVLVNDRLDVAMASGAHGVHLPADGLPVAAVRDLIELVGVSTHSVDEAQAAESSGANFIVFGPVFDTPGKTPVGIKPLEKVVSSVRIPVLAIGGITDRNTPQVLRTGAAGIAAIRLFQEAV